MADAKMKVSQMGAVLAMDDDDLINVVTYNDQSQTYVSGKATGAKVKEYMVGDNDISALGDGSVTGAILNVKSTSETADSNIAETMAQNGAHNLLPYPYYAGGTQIISGTTFTVASDGAITVSGTPSAYTAFILVHNGTSQGTGLAAKFAGKSITISGGASDVTGLGIGIECLDASNNTLLAESYIVAPRTINVPSNTATFYIALSCTTTFAGTATVIKPMIKLATDPSTEYAPHAMTNRELTKYVIQKTDTFNSLTTGTNGTGLLFSSKNALILECYDTGNQAIIRPYTYNGNIYFQAVDYSTGSPREGTYNIFVRYLEY